MSEIYDNGMPVDVRSRPLADDRSASINILNLGRELEAMEDMRRQAERGRNRAKKSWESDMQTKAIQAQREAQAREQKEIDIRRGRQEGRTQAYAVSNAWELVPPKKSAAPLAPAGKFNRKIDWKE
jgi:flagellar biosynthesis/type III secretory pathway protein FliH